MEPRRRRRADDLIVRKIWNAFVQKCLSETTAVVYASKAYARTHALFVAAAAVVVDIHALSIRM